MGTPVRLVRDNSVRVQRPLGTICSTSADCPCGAHCEITHGGLYRCVPGCQNDTDCPGNGGRCADDKYPSDDCVDGQCLPSCGPTEDRCGDVCCAYACCNGVCCSQIGSACLNGQCCESGNFCGNTCCPGPSYEYYCCPGSDACCPVDVFGNTFCCGSPCGECGPGMCPNGPNCGDVCCNPVYDGSCFQGACCPPTLPAPSNAAQVMRTHINAVRTACATPATGTVRSAAMYAVAPSTSAIAAQMA